MVLFNPGDEVIIPQPYWVTFPAQVRLAGAKPVFVDTMRTGYQLAPEDLEKAISPATKAVILNSPNNPTGVIYEPGELRRISKIALERKIWIIFDSCALKHTLTRVHDTTSNRSPPFLCERD